MTKRLINLTLAAVLILSLFSSAGKIDPASAADEWTLITTAAEFDNIRNGLSGNYRLMADIDLSGYPSWTPIGSDGAPFLGKLDGNSRMIRNLIINDTAVANKGLFGVIGGTGSVTRLGIEGANITAGDYAGILAGKNLGSISSSSVKGNLTGKDNVGGLVGSNAGSLLNSYSAAYVTGRSAVGGLAGINTNTGTIATSYSVSRVASSVFNTYLQFDGVDDFVQIGHNTQYETATFTLEAWVQWDEVNRSAVNFIVGKGYEQYEIHTGGGSLDRGIRFIPVSFTATVGGEATAYQDARDVIPEGWFHVAVVWNFNAIPSPTAQVYINGVARDIYHGGSSVGTTASVPLISPTTNPLEGNVNDFFIGMRSDSTFPFKGKISDVRFWNTARTSDQIDADKFKQLTGAEEGLIGYWKLDEASGDTAEDASSYHNPGMVNGATRVRENLVNFGGLVGLNNGTVDVHSYYDSQVSGQLDNSGKGVPKTTLEMQSTATYSTWDTAHTWRIDNGVSYPYFAEYTLLYAAGAHGSLTGAASQTLQYGSTAETVTAVPATGYHFVQWSDGVMTASRTDGPVASNLSVTATFAPDTIAVTFDPEGGAVSPASQTKLFDSTYGKASDGTTDEGLPVPTRTHYHFEGWYDGDNGTGSVITNTTGVSSPAAHSLYARWRPYQYTLTYAAGAHGSLTGTASQDVDYGSTGSAVTAVPDAGYKFVQWSDGILTATRTDSPTSGSISVTASFAPDTILVTYDAEGGTVSPASQNKLFTATYGKGPDGAADAPLPVPTWAYHHFEGWYDGDNGTGSVVTNTTTVSNPAAHNLYARWRLYQYTLTYSAGAHGSLTGTASQTVDYGSSGTLVTAAADPGYHFVKWSDDVMTAARTDSSVSGDITVTASFAPDTIAVTFDAEGGTVSPTSQSKLFASTYGKGADGTTDESLPVPTWAYHHFDGWYDGDNGTGSVITNTTTINATSAHTLYARWHLYQYTLTYAAGAHGSLTGTASQTVDHGGSGSLVTAVADPGYRFVQWSDGVMTAARTDGSVSGDITVTASFAPDTIAVTFDAEGGSVSPAAQSKLFASTYGKGADGTTDESLPVPTWAYHHFDGWYDGDNGTGSVITNTTPVNATSAHNLYARWHLYQYTLSYVAGAHGSLTGTASQTVDHGGAGTVVTAVADPGYHFVKWSDEVMTATRTDLNVSGDITLTASFAPDTIAVTFDAEGGSVSPASQSKLFASTYGKGADGLTGESLPVPTWAYHHFVDWYDGDGGTGSVVTNTTSVSRTAAHTLYARWQLYQYTLTYSAGAHGSLTGTASQTVDHGGSGLEVMAVADPGYHFVKWSDEVMTAARTDSSVSGDLSVTAQFAPDTLLVTFNAEGGTVSPTSQTKLFDSPYGKASDGTTDEALPVPSRAYHHFEGWYDGDNGTGSVVTNTTVVSDPAAHTLYARWRIYQYTLTYTAGEHGSLTGTASQTVDHGGSGSAVTAVPDSGYHFVRWSDGVLTAARTDLNVTENLAVTAVFAKDEAPVEYKFYLPIFDLER